MFFSIFESLTRPKATSTKSVDELEAMAWLEQFSKTAHASDGFSPACFREDQRSKDNVIAVYAIGLDFDKGEDSCAGIAETLANVSGLVYSTKSHTPAVPRCRALVFLSRPVSAEEYAIVHAHFAAMFEAVGVTVDNGAKDASRFWFFPCRPLDGGKPFFCGLHGEPVDVDSVLHAAAEPKPEPEPAPQRARDSHSQTEGPKRYASKALDSAIDRLRNAPKGERNNTLAREAYGIGQVVGAGHLTHGDAHATLLDAIGGWDKKAMRTHKATLARQLKEGMGEPRQLPEKRQPARADRVGGAVDQPPANDENTATDDRPVIMTSAELHEDVTATCRALERCPSLYQRDSELVRVVRAALPDEGKGIVEGAPQIRAVQLPTLRELCTESAIFMKMVKRKGDWFEERSRPSDSLVAAVLARGEYPPGIRALEGVIDSPCMRPDGELIQQPGYDAATGLLYEPGCEVPHVGNPERADAMRSLISLCDVFVDFPFASDAARYVPIAAVLTLLARYAIKGPVPLFVFDASVAGSGKGLLANTVSTIPIGRAAPCMTYTTNEEELEKTLCAVGLSGARLINLDNINGVLGSAPLDRCLTCEDRIAFRILGKSEMREVAWRTVVCATGNNIMLGADAGRRSIVCRMEPDVERPEERTGFKHPDLLGYVQANRGRLIADGLTILRAYVLDGELERHPQGDFTWGSFQAWADIVPAAIVWAGGANVLACRAVSMGAPDPIAEAVRVVLLTLPAVAPKGITARDLVNALWPQREWREPRAPDGHDPLREALETLAPPRRPGDSPDARAIGKALRKHVGRVMGGKRLLSEQPNKAAGQVWSVVEAGNAGNAGNDPNPSRERDRDLFNGMGGKHSQPSQRSQHGEVA